MLNLAHDIINEVKSVIVGKDEVIKKTLMVMLAEGHILLEDVPGVGKTTLALAFSRAMNFDYRRIQFTSDTMASDIVGFSVYNKKTEEFEYKPGAAFCNLLLADEINRTSPRTQAALLEVMEEKKATVDGITRTLPHPFICIATQNPLGSAGTQVLPDSQLDRFMVQLSMGYPSLEDQLQIIKSRQASNPLEKVKSVVTIDEFSEMSKLSQKLHIADEIVMYAAEICEATRHHQDIAQGVSPRAVQAMTKLSKAKAYLDERSYVIPEDVRDVFFDACAHRVVLTSQAKVKGMSPEATLGSILKETKAPVVV